CSFDLPATSTPPYFYSLAPRRPPSSPLFPYTTLFRSPGAVGNVRLAVEPQVRPVGVQDRDRIEACRTRALEEADRQHHACFNSIDRKSTRLNSSHVAISYAVFCLKKKIRPGTTFQA